MRRDARSTAASTAVNGESETATASASRTPREATSSASGSRRAPSAPSHSLASDAWPERVARNPSGEIIGRNAAYVPLGRPSRSPSSTRRNCVSAGISDASEPHAGVIHHSLHRPHAVKRAQRSSEARRTTWRLTGWTTSSSTCSKPRMAASTRSAVPRASGAARASTDSTVKDAETPARGGPIRSGARRPPGAAREKRHQRRARVGRT